MTTLTNFGRAGSPLPAAHPHNDGGAHGVTRPTHVPIPAGNWFTMVWSRKSLCVGAVLALVMVPLFCGCVTEAQANARAREAYLAGQKAALASMAGQGQGVAIVGPVQYHNVPWVEGLTLSQAIATATYTGHRNPKFITLTRQGEQATINPKDLLNGNVVPLEPGDTIMIQE